MSRAILLCGKIASGKSTLAEDLAREENAVVLSCDELMLRLFPEQLGERHDEVAARVRQLLLSHAAVLLAHGLNVVLDWGFWQRAARQETDRYFKERGFATQWIYVRVSDEQWRQRIAKRNAQQPAGSYFVDENLMAKCAALFEEPDPEEGLF